MYFIYIRLLYGFLTKTDIMKFSMVTFNKKVAKEYLSRLATNRVLTEAKIEEYTLAMKTGNWHLETAEFIKIDVNNNVNDGQHRLHAIVRSGVTLVFPVATDLPVDSQNFMDQGRPRSISDVLSLNGAPNSSTLASAFRVYLAMENGEKTASIHARVQNATALEIWKGDLPFWNGVCEQSRNAYSSFNHAFPISLIAGFIAYAKKHSYYKNKVDEFIDTTFHDNVPHNNKAVVAFRRKMQLDLSKRDKISKTNKLRYLVRTYEKYVTNNTTGGIILNDSHTTIPK